MGTIRQTIASSPDRFRILVFIILIAVSCSMGRRDSENKKDTVMIRSSEQPADTPPWKKAAKDMVSHQLKYRGIADQEVLRVMENTPRHLFVPENLEQAAYYDGPLPIGEGQTISQPYIVAIMTELLQLEGHEKVLEIGTGSGYQAAVLSQLVDTCYSIEIMEKLAERSAEILKKLGYTNVMVKCDDGYRGWPEHAPFDRIILTAAPPEIPQALVEQLKPDGIMVLPVGRYDQELIVVTRTKWGISRENIIPVRFVPMVKPD